MYWALSMHRSVPYLVHGHLHHYSVVLLQLQHCLFVSNVAEVYFHPNSEKYNIIAVEYLGYVYSTINYLVTKFQ